ncbi:MAG: hypothetical protein A2W27_06550 [Deltaproteobacteria bacterium RBG_16_44_11]|nr:MAG: hypothetical protein A2W27_06550 [Deltaproteobacteria bacterium RBG_16_44_11]
MKEVTGINRHLTPLLLQAELRKLKRKKPYIYLYHMNPSYQKDIRKEVAAIKERKINIIEDGQVIRL